ncbi:uncharacterized protein PHACADRAFT_33563 [Phanerochaete carnosa HHB-10118-sp]|uniref:Uncharacterized protein n=1 Tax=Phanerochaete carnosa (strain HHB-10118-sp) TaxID=650164 RepID=K5VR62_PHACS|nr:uncharacterized protein PHACADRAFT_33563 [Phanerochaete carnosa HHB-10118-sp]EKM49225.1 hypothetical protein PHACADRAFT_33563 [Phanerochaete carnosa HHB-10118-sp]
MADPMDGINELLARHRGQRVPDNATVEIYKDELRARDQTVEDMRTKILQLQDLIDELKDQIAELKSKKKRSKGAASSPAVLEHATIIESRARLYLKMFGLWISTAALNTPITFDPRCDLFRESRFTNEDDELQAEAEQVHMVYHLLPSAADGTNAQRDAITALIGRSPGFTDLFSATMNSHRYTFTNSMGKAMALRPPPGIGQAAWTNRATMASDPVAQRLRGDVQNNWPPVLFREDRINQINGLYMDEWLPKLARFCLFGPTSVDSNVPGNAGALEWRWCWITPQLIASTGVLNTSNSYIKLIKVIFWLSGDAQLLPMGCEPVKRAYQDMWKAHCKMLIKEWNHQLLPARRLWQSIVFHGVRGAEAYSSSQNAQTSSGSEPDPDFGSNNEFLENYERCMSLNESNMRNTSRPPSPASLHMPIFNLFVFVLTTGFSYTLSFPFVLSLPHIIGFTLLGSTGGQPECTFT